MQWSTEDFDCVMLLHTLFTRASIAKNCVMSERVLCICSNKNTVVALRCLVVYVFVKKKFLKILEFFSKNFFR